MTQIEAPGPDKQSKTPVLATSWGVLKDLLYTSLSRAAATRYLLQDMKHQPGTSISSVAASLFQDWGNPAASLMMDESPISPKAGFFYPLALHSTQNLPKRSQYMWNFRLIIMTLMILQGVAWPKAVPKPWDRDNLLCKCKCETQQGKRKKREIPSLQQIHGVTGHKGAGQLVRIPP